MKRILYYLLMFALLWAGASCRSDNEWDIDEIEPEDDTTQTVIMFFPWSTDLYEYFQQNIADFAHAIERGILKHERVVVCIASSASTADLLELKYQKGKCVKDTLKANFNHSFTTRDGITDMLVEVKGLFPADKYAMIIGCHGMGWLPISQTRMMKYAPMLHYEVQTIPQTRYFGGLTSNTQIEVKTLADGIVQAGMKMEYILFDDCYMSSIEAAYDLKEVTDHLIGCPTEVLVYGFPYHICGEFLIGKVDYQAVIDAFYKFYSLYHYPYGTASVIDCKELDSLAAIAQKINATLPADYLPDIATIQVMDGYTPTIFFDYGDFVSKTNTNATLMNEFLAQLDKAVPYKCHTKEYYSAISARPMPITTYSGITTSEPSVHILTGSVTSTAWYKATH